MQVWKNEFLELEIDPLRRVVRHRRTGAQFKDLAELRRTLDSLNQQMASLQRADYDLIQDMRAAPGRNDEAFEAVMARERPRMSGGFRRIAILVATQVGRLQVQRYVDKDATLPARVFMDEAEALRWFAEPAS